MPSEDARLLQNMTWEEFGEEAKRGTVVILPVGSTEQHGGHLPVGTDTMVAIALAEAASVRTGAVVAPPIWYGWSPHHMVLPGTVTVRPEVLLELVYDVMESLAKHGCRRLILINGHRIVNIPWMQIAAERARRLLGIHVVLFDPAYMSKEIVDRLGFGPLGHAEEIESSHMWYCHPELYHAERAVDYVPGPTSLYSVDPRYSGDTLCYVPSTAQGMSKSVEAAKGTTGSPTKASREKGREYHEHLVARLVEVVEQMRAF
ncbi:MAG: creatininase family protein [Bacillota bacterium]